MQLVEALRTGYLADGLSDEELQGLVELAEFVEVADLEDIVRANDVSYDLYVLLDGSVEVTTEHGDIISRLKPGAIIGEFAFFEGGQRSATVMSHGPSKLLHLNGEKLLAHMDRNPRVGMMIYRNLGLTLCQRMRSANVQIERLVSAI